MDIVRPESPAQLAQALADLSAGKQRIRLAGNSSKAGMAGPLCDGVALTTAAMNRVLQYEPRDLTISVEAGMRWAELSALLEAQRQMIPLDPPFFDSATVGGVVAANTSGPRRRLYGSVRDAVIGMKFATLEGKLIQAGGMVVKNVAGLDMSKLMIGSFGTLAAMAIVNFKLSPMPPETRTFLRRFDSLEDAITARNEILQGVLQPAAIDLLNPAAATRVGLDRHCLILSAGGSAAVMKRYEGPEEVDNSIWEKLREFTPGFTSEFPNAAVLRISTTLQGVGEVMRSFDSPVVCRAGSGVSYVYLHDGSKAALKGMKGAIEFAPARMKGSLDLWPVPGSDFAMMEKVKRMFDPFNLLNPGRLYGRI